MSYNKKIINDYFKNKISKYMLLQKTVDNSNTKPLKKHRTIVGVIVFLVIFLVVIVWIKSLIYVMENRDKIVFTYLLYDHVEYNGHAYYMSENQFLSFPESKEGTPVYLIYKGDKIYFEPWCELQNQRS